MSFFSQCVYGVFYALGAWISFLPFFVKDFFAQSLARLWFYGLRFRRRVILHNLSVVFTRDSQESMQDFQNRIEQLAVANCRHMILNLLEIFERFHWSAKNFSQKVVVEGVEHVRRLQKQGQGFFFVSGHVGNWELITMTGILLNIRLAVITKALRNRFFDDIWVKSRVRYGLELLEEKGSGLATIRAVREGKAVGFILDQHTGEPHGIHTKFLGLDAWCPKGLAILAWRLRVPVLPTYLIRGADGKHHLTIEAPLDFSSLENPKYLDSKGALSEAGLIEHLRICNENMESWIRRYPDQYLWMHRRFKTAIDYKSKLVWEL